MTWELHKCKACYKCKEYIKALEDALAKYTDLELDSEFFTKFRNEYYDREIDELEKRIRKTIWRLYKRDDDWPTINWIARELRSRYTREVVTQAIESMTEDGQVIPLSSNKGARGRPTIYISLSEKSLMDIHGVAR